MKKKTFPLKIAMSQSVRYEWETKEEGSWEDKGRPQSGHVYNVLTRNYKNGYLTINNAEEFALLQRSAGYQMSWDAGEDKVVDRLMKKADEISRL